MVMYLSVSRIGGSGEDDANNSPDEMPTMNQLRHATGQRLGHSPWLDIDQRRMNLFADADEHHQSIHTDPEPTATSATGTTIAHGYLTLKIAGRRMGELDDVTDSQQIVNYCVDKAWFAAALPSGPSVRTRASTIDVAEVDCGRQVRGRVSAEAEGESERVCVTDVQIWCLW
jgi:acyl dehydratase